MNFPPAGRAFPVRAPLKFSADARLTLAHVRSAAQTTVNVGTVGEADVGKDDRTGVEADGGVDVETLNGWAGPTAVSR